MYDVIIIGAGQAGLAMGCYLRQENKKFILLDKRNEVGETWRERYDSLVLFTPRMYSSLPGLSLEGDKHGFPTKDEIADYLKLYVDKFQLPIRFNEEVMEVTKSDSTFFIKTNNGNYESKNVVVATGPFQTPFIPEFSNTLSSSITQLHSSDYQNSTQLAKGNVLVVGGGNSGAQIAYELSQERETYLAVSKPLTYMPLTLNKKSIFWWFDKVGILKASTNSILGKAIQRKGDPVFGRELKQAIKEKKVHIKERVIKGNDTKVTFKDSTSLDIQNIIWATGFKRNYAWLNIEGIVDEKGNIQHDRGMTPIDGLFFVGLPWQHRRGSALLQGVGYDARFISEKIKS
ncbi:oxidoreductase [Priestia megaterium]|nr:oxidoreductase [Priestia megaterium]